MNVLIDNTLNNEPVYIATCKEDCKDSIDASVYDSVLFHNDLVTMGQTFGSPVDRFKNK